MEERFHHTPYSIVGTEPGQSSKLHCPKNHKDRVNPNVCLQFPLMHKHRRREMDQRQTDTEKYATTESRGEYIQLIKRQRRDHLHCRLSLLQASKVNPTKILSLPPPPPSTSNDAILRHWLPPYDPYRSKHPCPIDQMRREPRWPSHRNPLRVS